MADNTSRKSIVAPYIEGVLEEKHSHGYSYKSEELILNRFDEYCAKNNLETLEISRGFLSKWLERSETEGEFNRGKRISCVRQLLLFMASCGIHVYIPHDFCHFKKALPHIFDPDEITEFFCVVDSYQNTARHSRYELRMANEYSLLFRWYCCCGLRNNEAAGIKVENVDLDKGILTILDSKGSKDRLVYLPDDLRKSSEKYFEYLTDELGYTPKWFFPGKDPRKALPNTTVDSVFSRFWNSTKYNSCNNRPIVHDFRFTFVVMRMNLWAENDLDLQVMLPYLSRYLGHKSTSETLYYYYLVHDAYKNIIKKDTIADAVIPEVVPYE